MDRPRPDIYSYLPSACRQIGPSTRLISSLLIPVYSAFYPFIQIFIPGTHMSTRSCPLLVPRLEWQFSGGFAARLWWRILPIYDSTIAGLIGASLIGFCDPSRNSVSSMVIPCTWLIVERIEQFIYSRAIEYTTQSKNTESGLLTMNFR